MSTPKYLTILLYPTDGKSVLIPVVYIADISTEATIQVDRLPLTDFTKYNHEITRQIWSSRLAPPNERRQLDYP